MFILTKNVIWDLKWLDCLVRRNKHKDKSSTWVSIGIILMGIINQKEAAGVVAGHENAQQPDCVVTEPFFYYKGYFICTGGRGKLKGKNKWAESMQRPFVVNRGDRLSVCWKKRKYTLTCQFWTLDRTAGKSGQFFSILSSFMKVWNHLRYLYNPQKISSLKIIWWNWLYLSKASQNKLLVISSYSIIPF